MQDAETGDSTVAGRAAEMGGKEAENTESRRNPVVTPSKPHRNITLPTPELRASTALATRLQ